MTNEEIDGRIDEINAKIDKLIDERGRLNMIRSGYIVTDAEKVEQEKKADEARAAFDEIGKVVEPTPTVEETVAVLEGVQ